MSLSIGIVGLPNVGKSTLFNALLKRQAALAANYPFATIEPNVGIVPVPDERLAELARVVAGQGDSGSRSGMTNSSSLPPIKPATVEFVDIAGLVKGASKGEGLGNQFLAHIREVNLICHVVRDFSDENVLREGSVDAKTDLETIQTELLLADLATLEKQVFPKASKDKVLLERWGVIERFLAAANEGKQLREVLHSKIDFTVAKELNLLTAKKVLYIVNVDEDNLSENDSLIARYVDFLAVQPEEIVIISAKVESELASLSSEDQALFLQELGVKQSGLERLIAKAYKTLDLQSFLTAGELEVRAWTIKKGTAAPQAAGVIHTDFEKKFIKANVVSFDDFVSCGGWKAVKEKGKLRQEGRDYVMQEADVVEFMVGS